MSGIYRNSQLGRSMVEIVGVLAIMMLISAGAFVLIRSGMASQRRTIVSDDISKIVSGIRTLYADYDDLDTLDGPGALAAMGVDTDGPFEGTTYSVAKDNSNNRRFVVTISNLPPDECVILETKTWPGAVNTTPQCSSNSISITYNK